jgi:hypothetical protein
VSIGSAPRASLAAYSPTVIARAVRAAARRAGGVQVPRAGGVQVPSSMSSRSSASHPSARGLMLNAPAASCATSESSVVGAQHVPMPNLHPTHTVGDARGELIVGAQSSGSQPNVVAAQPAEGPHGVGLVATGCPCCDELERENGREQPKGLMHNGGRRSLGSVVRPRRGYCNPSPERMGSNSHDVDQLAQAAKVNGIAGIQARRVGMGGGRYQ